MFIFPKKKKPVDKNDFKTRTEEFLKTTQKFIKTTTVTITSLTALIGAASGLGLIIGIQLSPEIATDCSDEKLSIKYLNQEPLDTKTYLIEKPDVSMNMEISIYKDGDTLTTYGTYRKWVCFPQIEISHPAETVANSLMNFLIPQVVAQTTLPHVPERTTYIQNQILSPHNSQIIEQTRIYSNGTVEKTRIDRIRGIVLEKTTNRITITPELRERLNRGVEIEETTIINVE